MRLEAYFIGYFPDLSGARGRNRTTDTRIFNIDGSREFSEYSMLYLQETGVHKSVSWSF